MSDLVERLRERIIDIENEAAAEIERLRQTLNEAAVTLEAWQAALRDAMSELTEARDEIERLQTAKRGALAIADERSKENVTLRAALRRVRGRLVYSLAELMTDEDADAIAEADEALRAHEQATRPGHTESSGGTGKAIP